MSYIKYLLGLLK